MKTLLIDNYDSFTYNLYHLIGRVNGEEPVVIRNDEMEWAEASALDFDNIVISPGPGRPHRAADLGIAAAAIKQGTVPVLGVCLGHQAIAHLFGGTVDIAPAPMHGRISQVRHCGEGLFAGIPSPFDVVRYHSLVAVALPKEVVPTAWADDGTIMGLRHLTHPLFGVQFHPESICAEYGEALFRNFRDVCHKRYRNRGRLGSAVPVGRPRVGPCQSRLEVYARKLEGRFDEERTFLGLYGESPNAFWLDSALKGGPSSRFSFMGGADGPLSEVVRFSVSTGVLEVVRSGEVTTLHENIFDYLERRANDVGTLPADLPFEFPCGYVGYFGYELKSGLGGQQGHESSLWDSMWIRADRLIVFDHEEQRVWLTCAVAKGCQDQAEDWFASVERRMNNCAILRPIGIPSLVKPSLMKWRHDSAMYRRLIVRAIDKMRQGESYEICLTNQLSADLTIDGIECYRYLRAQNPAPYAAFLRFGRLEVLSSSPELFLSVTSGGIVESKPIKGTARRGRTPQEDLELAAGLASSVKNRAENLMIVDLLRNDIGRVCELGSVSVPALFSVETYATVHQLVSTIRGRLKSGMSGIDCVRATFPGGSMTGAPKIRTMQILDELEQAPRGIYSGALGYVGPRNVVKLNIVIRTIVSDGAKVSIGAGGAIVVLSDPDDELEEVALKTRAQTLAVSSWLNATASPSDIAARMGA